jgi:hypothetical protein
MCIFSFHLLGDSASQEISHLYGTARLIAANGRIGKGTPVVPPLTQMNPFRYVFQLRSIYYCFLLYTNVFQEYQTHPHIDQTAYTVA